MANRRICSVGGCNKPAHGRGFCASHGRRSRIYGDPLFGLKLPNGTCLKYLRETVLTHTGDDCLVWPYSRNKAGYGQINLDGRPQLVSRVVCRLVHGEPVDETYHAAHGCGKGAHGCVSPKHVRWATPRANMSDKVEHGTLLRGSRAPGAKITEADVRDIRAISGVGRAKIGARYGISRQAVNDIIHRRTWRHVA